METSSTTTKVSKTSVTTIEYSKMSKTGLINPEKTSLINKTTFLKLAQHERFALSIHEVASQIIDDGSMVFTPSSIEVLDPLETIPVAETVSEIPYLGAKAIDAALRSYARDEKRLNQIHWVTLVHTLTEEEWDQLWTTNPHRINVALACSKLGLC
jgi:hypothetical protein